MFENSSKQFRFKGLWLLLTVVMVALLLLLPDIAGAIVKQLQSSADVTLDESNSSRNFGSSAECYVGGSGSSRREKSTILAWDLRSIAGKKITKATIHLQVTNSSKDTFYVYGLKKPWKESEATWLRATKTTRWAADGASGSSDRQSSYDGRLIAVKTGTAKIALDPDLVQTWVDNSSKNYGVIIANRKATDDLGFYCSETTRQTLRPKLEVVYN